MRVVRRGSMLSRSFTRYHSFFPLFFLIDEEGTSERRSVKGRVMKKCKILLNVESGDRKGRLRATDRNHVLLHLLQKEHCQGGRVTWGVRRQEVYEGNEGKE